MSVFFMSIYTICHYPDPVLRKPCQTIDDFGPELQQLVDDMFETMYDANGVGLAAPQIGISKQLAVIDATRDKSETWVLINPEFTADGPEEMMREGCLSVPGAYDTVVRASKVTLKALDRHGKPYELSAQGLLAEAIQHETQHLQGKLFIDLLSPLKRERVKTKLSKVKRHAKRQL